MKIRIKDNSVRVRLTKSEIERFANEGYIESTTAFVSNTLTYALEARSDKYGHELSADFMNGIITMYIPEKMAKDWVETDAVGFETKLALDNGETLYLLLEKDFKCFDITNEDQSDNFENPLAFMHN
jgi:predicted nucleotidyltransferase